MIWKNKTKMAAIMEMKQILPPIPAPRASQQPCVCLKHKARWTGHSFSLLRASPEEQERKHRSNMEAWVAPTGDIPSGPPETELRGIPENSLMEF